jgi:hypothetical protein
MKASELRIGNYFLRNNIASQVHPCIIEDVFNGKTNIDPIPLTEEWLLKLEFKYKEWDNNFIIKNGDYFNSIKKYDDGWYYNTDESEASCYYLTTIKYVHQLQNLYFALTDNELKVKEDA